MMKTKLEQIFLEAVVRRAGYSDKSSGWTPKTRLSNSFPSSAASTTRIDLPGFFGPRLA